MEIEVSDVGIHAGHRSRMRSKMLQYGASIFDTYELLEMLLYYVIPYKDTNPVAKRLLMRFGSLDGVLCASPEELSEVAGIGPRAAEFLTRVGGISDMLGADLSCGADILFKDYHKTGSFFAERLGGLEYNAVLAMYLNNNMRLIAMEEVARVDYDSGAIRSAPIIDSALRHHASVVITAHNHPCGPFFVSEGDNQTNSMLTDALSLVSVTHLEHFLVCGRYYVGSLRNPSYTLSQYADVAAFLSQKRTFEGRSFELWGGASDDTE